MMDMTAKKLDGSKIAAEIREEVAIEVAALGDRGLTPRLDVILVGKDPASQVYVGSKTSTLDALGMTSHSHKLPETTRQAELEALVDEINADPAVDGILIQLPLPEAIDAASVLRRIDPAKDVDGLHPENVGLLQQGRPRLVPCTPAGVMEMLRREEIEISGRRAVVVGRSDIVGKPMAMLLLHAHATVTVCHSRTHDLAAVTRQADILVAAVGVRSLIGPEHVADGAVVVDVGMHRVTDRETVEQLYPDNEKKIAAFEKRGARRCRTIDHRHVDGQHRQRGEVSPRLGQAHFRREWRSAHNRWTCDHARSTSSGRFSRSPRLSTTISASSFFSAIGSWALIKPRARSAGTPRERARCSCWCCSHHTTTKTSYSR
jgi:methylenetetrahydrofolate dehydrogenase (NADP+)/methenyltetrahydrofolate cyclohydrolase